MVGAGSKMKYWHKIGWAVFAAIFGAPAIILAVRYFLIGTTMMYLWIFSRHLPPDKVVFASAMAMGVMFISLIIIIVYVATTWRNPTR